MTSDEQLLPRLLQLPFLLGVSALEKIAAPLAPVITGRTGRQLFLTDGKASDRPLLLRMSSDCKDGQFMYVYSKLPSEELWSLHHSLLLALTRVEHDDTDLHYGPSSYEFYMRM